MARRMWAAYDRGRDAIDRAWQEWPEAMQVTYGRRVIDAYSHHTDESVREKLAETQLALSEYEAIQVASLAEVRQRFDAACAKTRATRRVTSRDFDLTVEANRQIIVAGLARVQACWVVHHAAETAFEAAWQDYLATKRRRRRRNEELQIALAAMGLSAMAFFVWVVTLMGAGGILAALLPCGAVAAALWHLWPRHAEAVDEECSDGMRAFVAELESFERVMASHLVIVQTPARAPVTVAEA